MLIDNFIRAKALIPEKSLMLRRQDGSRMSGGKAEEGCQAARRERSQIPRLVSCSVRPSLRRMSLLIM